MKRRHAARISDIAREAGVGTATVDRVLNRRGGVSVATEQRVRRAMASLAADRKLRSSSAAARLAERETFLVLLPMDAGPSTDYLGHSLVKLGTEAGFEITCRFVEKMNPAALADELVGARSMDLKGVAFQALDHPLVQDAASAIAADGVPVVALMSSLGGHSDTVYVGMDNRAAGRTAGFMMGRLVRQPGRVAVIWGGQLYRCHELREIGFRSVIRAEYPDFEIIDLVSGGDDSDGNYRQINRVLDDAPDLVGIYSVGGGNRGVVQALRDREQIYELTLIGHNLTVHTRRFLIEGAMDVVIHQDMAAGALLALSALSAGLEGRRYSPQRLPVEIVTRENMEGHLPEDDRVGEG